MQHELILAGGGSGTADYLLPAAKKALESADCVIASERFLSLLEVKKARPMGNISRLLQELPELLETERIGIVVSVIRCCTVCAARFKTDIRNWKCR